MFEIAKGIGFILLCQIVISFFNPNKNINFAMKNPVISMAGFFGGIALLPLVSLVFFPLWFMFICYGVLVTTNLGANPNASPLQQSAFERRHGMLFNNIGSICFVVGFVLMIYQTVVA